MTIINKTYLSLSKLPKLNKYNVTHLYINNNNLTNIDNLPDTLIYLNCGCNFIKTLDYLPFQLETLICSFNQITSLDYLPCNLKYLDCSHN